MDFIYKKAGTIFNMHSYWTKQPVDPIVNFISKFCPENGTILDPFCGTGMTGVAAIMTGRNVILNDISPLSLHIAKGYCTDYFIQKNSSEIANLRDKILSGIDKFYLTKCTNCSKSNPIRFCIVGEVWENKDTKTVENRGEMMLLQSEGVKFDKNNTFKSFDLLKICYLCSCKKDKQYKSPDRMDLKLYSTEEYLNYTYPTDEFFGQEPRRNYKRGIYKVYQMYSKRNLTALSTIKNRIDSIKDPELKQFFRFVFSSILFNSSLMSRYRGYENTSIKMGTFYIPPLIKDTNVLDNFNNKLSIIIKGNDQIFTNKSKVRSTFLMESADELKSIPKNSIDYIYTDPPYADILSYSELNIVYESWLGMKSDNKKEMIVSKFSKKTIENFAERFEMFLKRSHDLLKNMGYLSLVFHTPNIEYWRFIQIAIHNSGFEPIKVTEPDRLVSNSKTSSQHKTKKNSQSFLIFTLRKNLQYKQKPLRQLSSKEFEKLVSTIRSEAVSMGYSSSSDSYDYIINRLIFQTKIQDFKV
jgi:DNA modification methylase